MRPSTAKQNANEIYEMLERLLSAHSLRQRSWRVHMHLPNAIGVRLKLQCMENTATVVPPLHVAAGLSSRTSSPPSSAGTLHMAVYFN
jgi:hypothetical protein